MIMMIVRRIKNTLQRRTKMRVTSIMETKNTDGLLNAIRMVVGSNFQQWLILGIKANCLNAKLNGILYSNRAAANKQLGNCRSAIKDSIQARRFDPTNLKVYLYYSIISICV